MARFPFLTSPGTSVLAVVEALHVAPVLRSLVAAHGMMRWNGYCVGSAVAGSVPLPASSRSVSWSSVTSSRLPTYGASGSVDAHTLGWRQRTSVIEALSDTSGPAITAMRKEPTEFACSPLASGVPTVRKDDAWAGGEHEGYESGAPC